MKAKVILNPYAGRWSALKRREEVTACLQVAGVDHEMDLTTSPGHGSELAAKAVREGFSPVIAAGGDGSISEVVNGILQACGDGPLVPFGVLPLGSANDLADNLGLPKDLNAAARVIAAGKTRLMDLCQVNWQKPGQEVSCRYFDNNAAVGLEPYITLIQQRMTHMQGVLRYLLATLRGIADNPKWIMELEWETGSYRGPVTLVTVGNHPRTGGLFYVTPHADPFDGLLTFVYAFMPTRLQILRLLPRTMKPGPGSYVEHPDVHEVFSPWLRVRSQAPTPLHADGEIQSKDIQELEFHILPARLPVLYP